MKNNLFTLLLITVCAMLSSCMTQSVFNLHHARSESLWKTQPRINEKEAPATARLDSVDAKVYSNAVFFNARSGPVKPIEIRVFDQFGNDGIFDTVYIREGPPKSTLVYHKPKLDPGIWLEEGARLDPTEGEKYLALANLASSKARKAIVIRPAVEASSIDMSDHTEYATAELGVHGGRDAALEKKAKYIILE